LSTGHSAVRSAGFAGLPSTTEAERIRQTLSVWRLFSVAASSGCPLDGAPIFTTASANCRTVICRIHRS